MGFFKSSTLGRYMCSACCSRWGAVCAKFARRKKERAKMPRFDSSPRIFSEFEMMTKPSSPKATAVRRCCCASTAFLDGSYTGCVAAVTPAQKKKQKSGFSTIDYMYVWKLGFFNIEVPPLVCRCLLQNFGPSEALPLFLLRSSRRNRKWCA